MASSKSNTIKLKFDTARNLAPAPESKSAAKINPKYDLFINGKMEKPSSKKYFDTINPATEEKLAEVADANQADVNKAVSAARQAYERVWKKMPARERSKYIYRIARMILSTATMEFVTTRTESEALLLEANLIKQLGEKEVNEIVTFLKALTDKERM